MKTKIKEMIKQLEKAGYTTITVTDEATSITGILYGDNEMYDCNKFYQLLLTEEGKIYKCYYNTELDEDDENFISLDEIDYTQPENVEEITEEIINEDDTQEEQLRDLVDFITTTAKI